MARTAEPSQGEEFRQQARRGLTPEAVRALSQLSPLRAILSLVETFGIIALCLAAARSFPHPLVIALAVVGISAGQHGLAILAHQSAHYRLYQRRWLNDLVGRLCALPLFFSVVTYRVIHRTHHNHLYQPNDPDLALMAGYPRGRAYLAKKLLKDLLGLTLFKNFLYFLGRPQAAARSGAPARDDTAPALQAAARRDRRLVLLVHAALLPLFLLTGWWRAYLFLWVLPLATVLQVLLRLRAICEHGAVPDLRDPFRAARTNLAPAPIRWILFPHQMHYHIEHHLYPSVPHYRLPECHRQLVASGALEGAEVSGSFGETLRKIFADPRPQRRPGD
jgi:fatty acid desaturase